MTSLALPAEHRALLGALLEALSERRAEAWLVGGYLRDLVRGQPGSDFDVAVDGPALDLARSFADRSGGAYVPLDAATESARIVWKAQPGAASTVTLDLVRLRAPTITADLAARDLTINALALPLALAVQPAIERDALLDPVGGRSDLAGGLIRPCSPTALLDDPLRLLRAVRFAAQLDFALTAEAETALSLHAARIKVVAQERIRDELLKLLAVRHAASWLAYLDQVGLLTAIIPELEAARGCVQPSEHFLPVLDHLFETVSAWEWLYDRLSGVDGSAAARAGRAARFGTPAAVERYPDLPATLPAPERLRARLEEDVGAGQRRGALFKLAALLHDVGKPVTRQIRDDGRITFYDHQAVGAEMAAQIGQRLRLPREAVSYLKLIVAEHMRPGQLRALGPDLTRRALYRLLRDTGAAAPEVLLHGLCDHMAARGPHLSPPAWLHHLAWTGAVLQLAWEGLPQVAESQPAARLINGDDLIRELKLTPGPLIGRALAAVQEAQFMGEIQTRAEALALAARFVQQELREPHA
jgi:poly(A) polymerase/tRNA nucleotidyltransferase (CCA-adding enzyme)